MLTDQVDFDYSRMFGATMPNTADVMIEKVRANHAGLHGIQHLISNHIVEIDVDTALCRSNYIAHHWFPNPQGDPNLGLSEAAINIASSAPAPSGNSRAESSKSLSDQRQSSHLWTSLAPALLLPAQLLNDKRHRLRMNC